MGPRLTGRAGAERCEAGRAGRGGGGGGRSGGRRGRSVAGMEPWKQCGQWLISCKVLPPNHRVTWETAQVFDLAQTLRDGVLLCQLLNNLRSHSINLKEINLRPQMSQVRPRGRPRLALPSPLAAAVPPRSLCEALGAARQRRRRCPPAAGPRSERRRRG